MINATGGFNPNTSSPNTAAPASGFTSTYEPDPGIPGNGTTVNQSGDTTISQHSGCWGPTGPAQAKVGPDSTYDSRTNADGSTDVEVNGETLHAQGKVDFEQHDHSSIGDLVNPPSESTSSTTNTERSPWNIGDHSTTTTTHRVGNSSVETTERISHPEFGGEFKSAGKTTVHVGAGDNVNVNNNADGSADVTIDGVTQHLSPEQAANLEVVKDPNFGFGIDTPNNNGLPELNRPFGLGSHPFLL